MPGPTDATSGASPPDPNSGANPDITAAMDKATASQTAMFIQSMQINAQQSELQTWGNLGEEIAKAKPQV